MYAAAVKSNENKSRAVANSIARKKSEGRQDFGFEDTIPKSVVQRTVIYGTVTEVPGTKAENDDAFKVGFALDTSSMNNEQIIKYINFLINKFGELKEPSFWDARMVLWLEALKGEYEEKEKVSSKKKSMKEEEEESYEFFRKKQLENKKIVLSAILGADAKIIKANKKQNPFKENLNKIHLYLIKKASKYDEGHFLCSPGKKGPANELAHSKSGGAIELFKGFFESSASVRADLLVHEAVHSELKVPDYAYMWQPIFRFLPIETHLKNPDSYVAFLRESNKEKVKTPKSENDKNDRVVGMIQHVCMRGAAIIGICKNQLDQFDNKNVPEPLFTLKKFRSNYDKIQLTFLIEEALKAAPVVSQMVISNQITINIKKLNPKTLDDASGQLNKDYITVDYIDSDAVEPFVAILAKILMILKYEKKLAKAIALSLNEMADKRLMSSKTLKPTI
jgi:hypothetical protein